MSLPRQHQHANPYAPTITFPSPSSSHHPSDSRRGSSSSGGGATPFRLPRIFMRLFKFPQMDFELAVWEMTNLMMVPGGPKKVVRGLWYHKQTKNTYTPTDPAFPYLLCFFTLLTSLAWSLAYGAPRAAVIARIAAVFVLGHCLGGSLLVAAGMYFCVGALLGRGGWLVKSGSGGGRGRGLFGVAAGGKGKGEELEFGFCFDVAIRAFFPLWVFLYVVQFLLLPAVTGHHWSSTLLSNTLHAVALAHSTYITFLGYNSLPFLSSTQFLLAPLLVYLVAWVVGSAAGWNASLRLAPILWCGPGVMRKMVG